MKKLAGAKKLNKEAQKNINGGNGDNDCKFIICAFDEECIKNRCRKRDDGGVAPIG